MLRDIRTKKMTTCLVADATLGAQLGGAPQAGEPQFGRLAA